MLGYWLQNLATSSHLDIRHVEQVLLLKLHDVKDGLNAVLLALLTTSAKKWGSCKSPCSTVLA